MSHANSQIQPPPARRANEDLFEDTRMSFGEHLEELRKVLFRALIGLTLGAGVGLWFGDQIVAFLSKPLGDAIAKFNKTLAKEEIQKDLGYVPPALDYWFSQGQVPSPGLVDPQELVRALQIGIGGDSLPGVVPGPTGAGPTGAGPTGAGATASMGGLQFSDFRDPSLKIFCRAWVEQVAAEPTKPSGMLWSRLSASTQQLIREHGAAPVGSDSSFSPATAAGINDHPPQRILAELNQLLADPQLVSGPDWDNFFAKSPSWWSSFAGTPEFAGAEEMRRLQQTEPNEVLTREVNRYVWHRVFGDYLEPLRARLVPLTVWKPINTRAQSLSITEPFMIWLKAGLIAGLFLSSPWVFYQLWSFVAAGLYPHEQRYVYIYLPMSLGLFFSGIFLAYFFVFDPVLQFLFQFNSRTGIDPQPRIGDWLSFVLMLPLGFGLSFQLPLVMLFLNRIGVFALEQYISKWRIAIMTIFVVSMLLTPADPISMILMAVPLTLLYLLGIGLCRWMPTPQNPFAEE